MKRWLAALGAGVLSAVLLVLAALPPANAATIYFTAVNDKMLDLTADSMPVSVRGVIYVPYTVFDANLTGVNLKVFYGQDRDAQTLTLYNRQKLLTFYLADNTVVDQDGTGYSNYAITRNGKAYVPIFFVCNFFGLTVSNIYTEYGYLIRVKSEDVSLTDAQFVAAAQAAMQHRLDEYNSSQSTPSVSAPASSPTPSASAGPRVYLAFRCGTGDAGPLLDALDSRDVQALFLFPPDSLADCADVVRRAVATGHSVGLSLPSGLSSAQLDEQLALGEALLAHIARAPVHIAEVAGGTSEERYALTQRGWLCWQANVSGIPDRAGGGVSASAVFSAISAKTSLARTLLDDSDGWADALPRLLSLCAREELAILPVTETVLS